MMDIFSNCDFHIVAGKRTANRSPSNSQSSYDLTTALSELKLNSQLSMKMKAEPATKLCDNAQQHGISSVPLMDHLKASTELTCNKKSEITQASDNSECIDLESDEIPPLAQRLKGHQALSSLTQQRAKSTQAERIDCNQACVSSSLVEATVNKPGPISKISYLSLVTSSQHTRADLNSLRTQEMNKKSVDVAGQFQRTSVNKQIVISDSSSESEVEDPLMPVPCKDMKVGGGQGVTSPLQYQYCDSSGDGASPSDDDIPPLANRIGCKRAGTSSSPLKTKLSPTKDLVTKSMTETAQVTTKVTTAKRKLGFESSKVMGLRDGSDYDVGEKDSSEGAAAYGAVGLSGTCCIGSAESPIEID